MIAINLFDNCSLLAFLLVVYCNYCHFVYINCKKKSPMELEGNVLVHVHFITVQEFNRNISSKKPSTKQT